MAAVRVDPARVIECKTAHAFDEWLAKNWDRQPEVWLTLHKVRSGLASITPAEAIDVALCWGWIDAIRKGLNDQSFLQRYTPRGKKSVWSKVNVANATRLIEEARMQPSGLAKVDAAKADGRWDSAYRMADAAPDDLLAAIRAAPKAHAMYETLTSQNRFALTFRTLGMKTAAGRQKKIASFVAMLARGETVYPNGKGTAKLPP